MKRVLIVDDVNGWVKFNSDVIKELFGDVEIVTANSASEAYDILLQGLDFDIVITDLQMEETFSPKYAGEWLVEQIRTFNRYNSTKVVMISASYNIRQIANSLGVECIPKSTALKCISAYKEVFNL